MASISATTANACGCCGGAPSGSTCALYIGSDNPFVVPSTPYASYSDAATAIAGQVGDCYAFIDNLGGTVTINSVTANVSVANQVTVTGDEDLNGVLLWVGISVAASATLTITFATTFTGAAPGTERADAALYDPATGTLVTSTFTSGTAGTLTLTGFAAGEYALKLSSNALAGMGATGSFQVTSNVAMVANPVVSQWDDSGTTRYLEACPKLKMPVPVKPLSGDWDMTVWYASCADAATALGAAQNPQTDSCVGACRYDPFSTLSAFTATDGGTSLSLAGTNSVSYTGSPGPAVTFYGCVNAVGSDTLSVAWSLTDDGGDGGSDGANLYVLNSISGAVLNSQSASGLSGTFTLTVPYSGAFMVVIDIYGKYFDAVSPPGSIDATADITSSGTLSVNPIQAYWDDGLGCPARLNCGDSC